MKSLFGLILCILLLIFAVKAQTPVVSPTPLVESEDGFSCGLKQSSIIQFDVSVTDSKNNNLQNLTYKDFEVFDQKKTYEVVSFIFDKLKNQFVVGVYEDDLDDKNDWRNLEIRVKLSKENHKNIYIEAYKSYRLD